MLKRLVIGVIVGLVVGAIFAAAFIKGLGTTTFTGAGGAAMAYVFAAITGAVTGLVAGKPFWSAEAKIEGGLKALFGALLGAGGMFALQRWGHVNVELGSLGAGSGMLPDLPAASLPLVGAVLGMLFELDNTGGESKTPETRTRIATGAAPARAGNGAAAAAGDEDDESAAVDGRARR